jgi:hypothetical protein
VHATIDAFEVQQTFGNESQDSLTGDERIEDAYGDVRMRSERRKAGSVGSFQSGRDAR